MYVFDKTFILVFKFIQYPWQKSLLVRSLWDLTFLRAFCSPGRTCLFCLPCGQGCCPRLDKKSCDWLLISLLMIELIPSHSLFCLARTIKLFLTVLKILLKSHFRYLSIKMMIKYLFQNSLFQISIIKMMDMDMDRPLYILF